MGMFDDIAGKAQGMFGQGGSGNAGIMRGIMELLSDRQTGGLGGIIQSFQQRGLGDVVSSWIGKGQNAPITPTQMREGLGTERISKVASTAGVSHDEAAAGLSEHLPKVVDQLTPDGTVPQGGMLDQGVEMLKSKLF